MQPFTERQAPVQAGHSRSEPVAPQIGDRFWAIIDGLREGYFVGLVEVDGIYPGQNGRVVPLFRTVGEQQVSHSGMIHRDRLFATQDEAKAALRAKIEAHEKARAEAHRAWSRP